MHTLIFVSFKKNIFIYVGAGYLMCPGSLQRSGGDVRSPLSPCEFQNQTQVIKLESKHLYPLSHVTLCILEWSVEAPMVFLWEYCRYHHHTPAHSQTEWKSHQECGFLRPFPLQPWCTSSRSPSLTFFPFSCLRERLT